MDDSTSFPPGWTIHQPFRPLQQRQIQLHANPPAPPFISFCRGKKHPHQPMQQKNTTFPNSSHLGMLGGQDTLLCLGWKGDVWSLGKNRGRKERQNPNKRWRDRGGDRDRDGQGGQAVWFCTPPERTRDFPLEAWSQCLCLIRSSAENVTYTELSRGLTPHYTHKTTTC